MLAFATESSGSIGSSSTIVPMATAHDNWALAEGLLSTTLNVSRSLIQDVTDDRHIDRELVV